MEYRSGLTRRHALQGVFGVAGALIPASAASAAYPPAPLLRQRLTLPSGLAIGEVDSTSAILWARASGAGKMLATLTELDRDGVPMTGRFAHKRVVRGRWNTMQAATADSDFTAKLWLSALKPGTEYRVELQFEDEAGQLSELETGSFGTPERFAFPGRRRPQSFVWSGDSTGQGWGINPELGGMRGYQAMLDAEPDFFIHSGDSIYADNPIQAEVAEPDGRLWRNLVTEEVSKVAETLAEFRGRHRYNQLDHNLRALYAKVPVLAQWDDHETHNNWYPGQILDDDRYTERRVDVLAARARQAWQENVPIGDASLAWRPGGFSPQRIYRKLSRGPALDVFALDMRTFKSPNTDGKEPYETQIFGPEQTDWLIREVSSSRATWKVICNDLPLGLVVPDGKNQESLSNGDHGKPLGKELELARVLQAFKRNKVRNVVWLTADVHYTAAHHYAPERAAFTDFDPFWEFVSGPISAGTFGPNVLDGTFGPKAVFVKTAEYPNQSPRQGDAHFFGEVKFDANDVLTVNLRDINGTTLFTQELQPALR
ncbi:alkaline phosphatase D family protein [Arthrobacter russicus]|uniref:Alkaline phosphatase D n=1 Tax=Arthrobacter russicus TaxID=172040 RepID=A0ABU1JGN1_9MICC|nr:alkaline phosphatase D family protein [Arthrobacter russicus]MDR6270531.1 alkaline phosphatase D [Arthrobacter russicus]